MSTYPTFEQLVKNPRDPDRILTLTPAYRSFLSLMVLWVLLVIVVLCINIWLYQWNAAYPKNVLRDFPARWLAVIPLALIVEVIRRKYNQAYVFGIDKATQQIGRLWFTYNETVIEYGDVRSINVVQTFWGRIFNYGQVEISTAAQEDSELVLQGIVSPEEFSSLVDQLRSYSRELDAHEHARTND